MSVLLILLPPRPRGGAAEPAAAADWSWVLSTDGRSVAAQGRGAPATWPRADGIAAVLADGDVAWHRITLPKAPAARLRQALQGVLEEQLLDEADAQHLALPGDAVAGRAAWVAVTHRPWLAAQLARLEAGGRPVDRVLPPAVPGGAAEGHFSVAPGAGDGRDADSLQLSWADADGVAQLGLAGTLARARVAAASADPAAPAVRWTSTPAAAAAAEAWLGHAVAVLGDAERALAAAARPWNLRQFELAPRHRGATALREGWRQFLAPAWRPARWGLVALAGVQLAGLNAWAWHEQRALDDKRAAMVSLLQTTHPQVRAVLDAPLQMARETERLRSAAGQPGDGDLETLLATAAAAWPEGEPPVPSLQFEPGRLALGTPDWDDEDVQALQAQLRGAGWAVARAEGQIVITRAPGAAP